MGEDDQDWRLRADIADAPGLLGRLREARHFDRELEPLISRDVVLSADDETLFAYAMLSCWVIYILGVLAVWVLRRKSPNAARPYKMWGYPFTVWAFVAVSIWFMADAMVNQPKPSLMAAAVCAAGIPFYLYWRWKSQPVAATASKPT